MSLSTKHSASVTEYSSRKEKKDLRSSVVKFVPILDWLPKYTRLDGVSDLVAGITVGLTLIPQSIAYAALAGLTAQYGLYSSFMGAFVYMLFGTTKEVVIGPSSLMALLTLEYTRGMPVDFVVLYCFLGGCIELMMGMLNLGFVVDFISMPVTSGFTSATSVIIIIAQLQSLFGLRFKAHSVVGNIFKIFENIGNVRLPDLYLGFTSIVVLLLLRKLKDLDCSFTKGATVKKTLWFVSICRNALVILITAVIVFHLEKTGPAPFILSGKVDTGFPKVSLPPFSTQVGNETYTFLDMCSHYGAGIAVLPLVSVLANVAIAKAFATGKAVDATQEMLVLGLSNILGSFVSSMPTAGAFTRSAITSASGIRTPLAGLYTGIMTLLALTFLMPYFYYIPRATLAAVLISAVIFMIDYKIVKLLWKGCKRDATAVTLTFCVCLICGVEIGLLVGALFNLIFFLRPSARPQINVLHCKTELGRNYVMLKPETGLTYPAVDYFCGKVQATVRKYGDNETPVIVNCERIRDIDYTAIQAIEKLSKDINADGNKLWLLNVHPEIVESIEILADVNHFRFINHEDQISYIYYDRTAANDTEQDAKTTLLREVACVATSANGYAEKNNEGAEEIPLSPKANKD